MIIHASIIFQVYFHNSIQKLSAKIIFIVPRNDFIL